MGLAPVDLATSSCLHPPSHGASRPRAGTAAGVTEMNLGLERVSDFPEAFQNIPESPALEE